MTEWRLFEDGTIPECATPEWYATRDHAPHLEQAAHHGRLILARDFVLQAVAEGAESISDLGAGDGGLLSLLHTDPGYLSRFSCWGYDLQPSNVVAAVNRGVDVQLADALDPAVARYGDCAIMTEMIEHLVDPHTAVRRMAAHADWLVASSPVNESAEHHYEFHLWAWDQQGYRSLMEQGGWRIVRHELVDGFQVILCGQQ